MGDRIYVIGGWSMNGGDSTSAEFLDTALVFDLARPGAGWEKLPAPPFRRRALAVGAIDGKVYAIGGLTEDGKVVKSVDHLRSRGSDVVARARPARQQAAGLRAVGVRRRRQAVRQRGRRPGASAQR